VIGCLIDSSILFDVVTWVEMLLVCLLVVWPCDSRLCSTGLS
jgi:hypothetical protein